MTGSWKWGNVSPDLCMVRGAIFCVDNPALRCVASGRSDSFHIGTDLSQPDVDVLVAAVDLVDIVDDASAVGG